MMTNTNFTRAAAIATAALLLVALSAHSLAGGPVCGDGLLGPNENCDDGNASPGDGCSASCIIENNYECSAPFVPLGNNALVDGGFEGGSPNPDWTELTTSNDTVICNPNTCPEAFGSRLGAHWARFGSFFTPESSRIEQRKEIPPPARYLDFDLMLPVCDTFLDVLEVVIDGNVIFEARGSDERCGILSYQKQLIDLATANGGPYNDGNLHLVEVRTQTFFVGNGATIFQVDNMRIGEQIGAPTPSFCEFTDLTLDYEDFDPGVEGDLSQLGFTTFELGDPVAWGTTDDGVCGSGQVPPGNFTGGAGEAACLDATTGGGGQIVSLFCTDQIDFSTALGSQLSFLVNVQLGQKTNDDFFTVLIGVDPPDASTIFGYQVVFETFQSIGDFAEPNGQLISLDISDLDGQPEGYVCFAFGSAFAIYAQVDEVNVSAQDCIDDNDEDKLQGCFDNCTERVNLDQTDSDGDGYGNACDGDIYKGVVGRVPAGNGNDCAVNFQDLGVLRGAFFGRPTSENWNPDADFNNDSLINVEDLGIMKNLFFAAPGPSGLTSACQQAP